MVAYFLNKYKSINKNKEIDKRLRRKFYRAYDITKKIDKSGNKSVDYMEGYMDGANLDEETKEFIRFING